MSAAEQLASLSRMPRLSSGSPRGVLPRRLLLSVAAILLLAGCQSELAAPPAPALSVKDQYLIDGQVVVREVVAPSAGWIVIRTDDARQQPDPSSVLGVVPVRAGTTRPVRLPVHWVVEDVEPMWAVLHEDRGAIGTFDADDPPIAEGAFFLFADEGQRDSRIVADDQAFVNRTVMLDEVFATEPGAVVIHRDNGRQTGPRVPGIIAITAVEPGLTYDVPLHLYEGEEVACGEVIWPMLHVRSTSDTQAYNLDQPIITVPIVHTCE